MPINEIYPIQEFLNYLAFQKRYSRNTVISYETDLKAFFEFGFLEYNITDIKEITSPMVRSWLASLKEKKMVSKTINRKISSLKSFFKYQLRLNNITVSPLSTTSSLKVSRKLPSFIEEKDIQKLFKETPFPLTWEGKLNYLIFEILYETGIRLSELINLKENQVNKSSGTIKVLGKGNKERLIPVSNHLLNHIDEYTVEKKRQFETTSLILLVNKKGIPLYPKYVYNMVKKYLSEISTAERKSPHIMRHSFATHLTNHGAPINAIKELLGHSSLAATQIYTHNSIEKLKEVYKQAHPKS